MVYILQLKKFKFTYKAVYNIELYSMFRTSYLG